MYWPAMYVHDVVDWPMDPFAAPWDAECCVGGELIIFPIMVSLAY
jgi:hypothetical protein